MSTSLRLLLVEDSDDDATLVIRTLRRGGFDVQHERVDSAAAMTAALARQPWDAVISDFSMPGFTGLDALGIFRGADLDIPFILISGTIGEETAVDAMNAGASDYVMKKSLERLVPALDRELKETQMRAAHRRAQEALTDSEMRFRQMAENIRDVFFLVSADRTQMLYVSPAYEEIWGRSCDSLYADPDSWTAAIHPDDSQAVFDNYKKHQDLPADSFEDQYRIVNTDGSVRWIQSRVFPVRDAAGAIVRFAGVAKDVTERTRAMQELRESERRFSDLLRNVQLVSLMLDRESRITFCNAYLLRLTGWQHEEVIGKSWPELFVPTENVEERNAAYAALLADLPESWHREDEILTRAGERRLIRWNNSVLRSGVGEIIGTASIGEDITEQRRTEIKIKRLNRVYAVLSGINTLIVRVGERDELFRDACLIAVDQGGFRMAWIGLVDRDAMELVPVAVAGTTQNPAALDKQRFSLREQSPAGNVLNARALREGRAVIANDVPNDPAVAFKDEHAQRGSRSMAILPLLVSGEAVGLLALYAAETGYFDDEELKLLTELAGDIAFAIDHIAKQEQIDYLAYYDPLERVAQYMRSAVSGGHKLVVFLLDLERFKNINDSLGQVAGDALLKLVAEWLARDLGDPGMLARLGADHFAVVLPEVRQEGDVVQLLENKMGAFLDHPFRLHDSVLRIPIKVGAAIFPDDGADADSLFRNAEAALKAAKAGGERYLFYTQKMTDAVAGKLTLENQLRQALDDHEFVLHYQPKVNLASGKLVGAEALIRWNDPRSGLVPPGHFIPILEETGLIHEVGRWVLRQAIADYLNWRAAGLPAVRIAVNVSPLQLRQRGFVAEIEEAIGIDARAAAGLELEITESVIMEDIKHNIASLQAIRDLGVRVAIDDFGTGFSSLSYLARLPVDTLKIDRSFVIDMTAGPEGLALVSTIINLAQALKLKVVAEGVETAEQQRLLRLLNCDEMQGYLFSKPLPADVFAARYLAASSAPAA